MEINYIGLQINNWIVTDVENVNLSTIIGYHKDNNTNIIQ